ncbi:MAG: hypothetical protein K2X36_04280 [Microbacteriaceae bacterium]|nr:hypothetical protein [Microbacteriaceae bacterium]
MDPYVLEELAQTVCERLWAVNSSQSTEFHLLLPYTRGDEIRVSEQESKIVICQVLEEAGWYYSVETPTRERYQQSGSYALSGRLDVSVYASVERDRVLNVELKQGSPPVEQFRKDFEKLIREGVRGLWFHTLSSLTAKTIPTVLAKMREAIRSVDAHAAEAAHEITFVICVLDREVALSARLPLGVDVAGAADRVFNALAEEWEVVGPGATAFRDARSSTAVGSGSPAAPSSRSGVEKLLIYCPELARDSFLHFSRVGDSYRLRAFSGTLAGRSPWRVPDARSAQQFLALHMPEMVVDVREGAPSLDEADTWKGIVDEHNRQHGIGV